MASSSDVRDIFSLPAPGGSGGSSSRRAGASRRSGPPAAGGSGSGSGGKAGGKKPDGLTRELYALLGDSVPSLAIARAEFENAQAEKARLKPKFKKRPMKAKQWVKAPFRNPARDDDLVLEHWVPKSELPQAPAAAAPATEGAQAAEGEQAAEGSQAAGESQTAEIAEGEAQASASAGASSSKPEEVPRDYKFAHFNTNSGVYSYSTEEYHQHLRDEEWSKEESDYLIDLCQAYDLRFVVIHDRWEWQGKERSIEDLKARYYALCRRLIRSRITTADMDTRQALLATYTFDRARETERKRAVERLFGRTPAQLAEEEALYVEIRRLEQNETRFAAEREDLLRLLGGWERTPNGDRNSTASVGAGLGFAIPGSVPPPEEPSDGKRKKRKANDGDDEAGPSKTQLTYKQKTELKQQAFDDLHCITRFDPVPASPYKAPYPHLIGVSASQPPVNPTASNQSTSHGAYLRSSRVLAPRATLALRVAQTLAELKPTVGARPVFPTARNLERWEGLIGAVTSGLEMKRQLDRIEMELKTVKARLAAQSQGKEGAAAGQRGASRTPAPSATPARATSSGAVAASPAGDSTSS